METIFKSNGGTYEIQGDYLLPNLALQEEEQHLIGVWGTRHKRYMKQCHKGLYYNFLRQANSIHILPTSMNNIRNRAAEIVNNQIVFN